MQVKRGDIFLANLSPVIGSEQSGIRPVVIVQNDLGNKYSPTVIALAITSKEKINLPTHIPISKYISGLPKNSVILAEQIRTLDKSRLIKRLGTLDYKLMEKVKSALKINFSIRGDFANIFKNW